MNNLIKIIAIFTLITSTLASVNGVILFVFYILVSFSIYTNPYNDLIFHDIVIPLIILTLATILATGLLVSLNTLYQKTAIKRFDE